MIRLVDLILSFLGILLLSPILVVVYVLGWFDTASPLFLQKRLGKNKKIFTLIKYRTMRPDTPSVASHLVEKNHITSLGRFLRKSKLDELPQLFNVLLGDMSLVGPRPNLPNQEELIQARDLHGVYAVRPGITGLAQIQNIDMSTPKLLAETDAQMIATLNFKSYLTYILLTVSGKGRGDAVGGSNKY